MPKGFQSVERLKIWQKSMDLVESSYRLASLLPADEKFGLVSQIRRAATSVPANIAEGFGRWNAPDFARFVSIASGSLRELETHIPIAQRLGYFDAYLLQETLRETEDLAKMPYRMRSRVLANIAAPKHKNPLLANRSSKIIGA